MPIRLLFLRALHRELFWRICWRYTRLVDRGLRRSLSGVLTYADVAELHRAAWAYATALVSAFRDVDLLEDVALRALASSLALDEDQLADMVRSGRATDTDSTADLQTWDRVDARRLILRRARARLPGWYRSRP